MTKHLFKVSGLDTEGKPFMGSCVAWDIIDAINMFREKNYSPHEIKQDVQMSAEHPCCIVCLQGAEESFVITQSEVHKTRHLANKPKEFPKYLDKPLWDIIKEICTQKD